MLYTKPALDNQALLTRLQNKGLQFNSVPSAELALSRIGYFRLLIYMRPFQNQAKSFQTSCTFEQIMKLYEFDRELRLLCLDAIERVEVALRAAVIETLALSKGAHFHTDASQFSKPEYFNAFWKRANQAESKAIWHYKSKYTSPPDPPIWVILEATMFGTLSKFFADLTRANRIEIAKKFQFHEKILVSWFRSLTVLRNNCAHHSRVWNAKFTVNTPIAPTSLASKFSSMTSFHAQATILFFLLKEIDVRLANQWRTDLHGLISKYSTVVNPTRMGFLAQNDAFWTN